AVAALATSRAQLSGNSSVPLIPFEMASEMEQPGAVGLCSQRAALRRTERGNELTVIEGLIHGGLPGAFLRVHGGQASASRAGAAIVQVGAVTDTLAIMNFSLAGLLWVARSGLGRCAALGPPTRNSTDAPRCAHREDFASPLSMG
ncbi:MAG: hypothetical protein VX152_12285, partial [Pseudomonadota bacterium]|nr:hypothetical protein [Pseudomonadota bacterium]